MLDKLRLNDSRTTSNGEIKPTVSPHDRRVSHNLNVSTQKAAEIKAGSDVSSARDLGGFLGSDVQTPATEAFEETSRASNFEMERVKKELEAARNLIDQQKRELEESRNFQHTMDQALPSPSELDFPRHSGNLASIYRYGSTTPSFVLVSDK